MREQFTFVIGRQRAAAVDSVDLFLRESNFKTVAALSRLRVFRAPKTRHGQSDDLLFAGGQGGVGVLLCLTHGSDPIGKRRIAGILSHLFVAIILFVFQK
jgi:hypothetical protein